MRALAAAIASPTWWSLPWGLQIVTSESYWFRNIARARGGSARTGKSVKQIQSNKSKAWSCSQPSWQSETSLLQLRTPRVGFSPVTAGTGVGFGSCRAKAAESRRRAQQCRVCFTDSITRGAQQTRGAPRAQNDFFNFRFVYFRVGTLVQDGEEDHAGAEGGGEGRLHQPRPVGLQDRGRVGGEGLGFVETKHLVLRKELFQTTNLVGGFNKSGWWF